MPRTAWPAPDASWPRRQFRPSTAVDCPVGEAANPIDVGPLSLVRPCLRFVAYDCNYAIGPVENVLPALILAAPTAVYGTEMLRHFGTIAKPLSGPAGTALHGKRPENCSMFQLSPAAEAPQAWVLIVLMG